MSLLSKARLSLGNKNALPVLWHVIHSILLVFSKKPEITTCLSDNFGLSIYYPLGGILPFTLAVQGGWCTPPPLRFFADSEKTAAHSAAGFWAT